MQKIDSTKISNTQIPHAVMVTVIPKVNELVEAVEALESRLAALQRPVKEELSTLDEALPDYISKLLKANNIFTIPHLRDKTDGELTLIKGIGPALLKEIREATR